MARFRVSYRLSLIVAIPLLVVGTGAIIASRTFLATRTIVGGLVDDLFHEVSQKTVDKTRSHLARAIPVVDVLGQLQQAGIITTEPAKLPRALIPVLRAHPSFSWVSYSDESGRFVGAYRRPDGTLRLNASSIVDGKTVLDEQDVGEHDVLTMHRHETDTGYDPRKRPFYQNAKLAGARAWTDPYVFFDSGVPGISCSLPIFDAQKQLQGVFSVDFDLNSLSEFVARLKLSPSSKVFVFTPDGKLLAHPTVRAAVKEGARASGDLTTIAGSGDPIAQALYGAIDAAKLAKDENEKRVSFVVDGQPYMASVTSFAIERGSTHRWLVGVAALESDFHGGIKQAMVSALGISAVALAGALILAVILAGQVSKPLLKLAQEMEKVGRFEVDDKGEDPSVFAEIHVMSAALAKMKGGLRSFANYVPRDLVRRLVASGVEAKLGGETQHLTIFFSDLAGFTTLAETLHPTELVRVLGKYFDEMARTIAQNGGTVDKFIGDGIMAFWGAPESDPEHATNACVAAIRCQQRLAELAQTTDGKWLAQVGTRIGIASGEVVVGNIGTPTRMNYTVMGDTANLAARLESLSKQYGTRLLADEGAVAQAKGKLVARPVDVVAVKGRAQGAKVYELLGIVGETDEKLQRLADVCARALDAYLKQRFADAAVEWTRGLSIVPGDSVCTVMRDRAVAYQKSPPPAGWNGTFIAHEK